MSLKGFGLGFITAVGILFFALLMFLAGCSKQEKAGWDTLEASRQQAIDNSLFNAKRYRDSSYPDYNLVPRGDSSIKDVCPQGDGWATMDLVKGADKVELKCSTVSGTIGCLSTSDFKKRPDYASQDGTCNKDIPFPLPKIQK